MSIREKKKKKKMKRRVPPSSYNTMSHYFPTEQVDIVKKVRLKKRIRKK